MKKTKRNLRMNATKSDFLYTMMKRFNVYTYHLYKPSLQQFNHTTDTNDNNIISKDFCKVLGLLRKKF